MPQFRTTLLAGGFLLALTAPASADIIFEESFEEPDVASWAVFQTGVGDNGDWESVEGSGIEIQDESIGITDAYDGEQYVELDSDNSRGGVPGDTNTLMAANVDFVAGQTYEISFAYQPRTGTAGDNGINLFALDFDGAIISDDDLLFSVSETTSTLSDWMIYSVIYTAGAGFNAIGFQAFGADNSLGGFIDAISVSEVPLPAALPMFGIGLAGLASLRRRKRLAI